MNELKGWSEYNILDNHTIFTLDLLPQHYALNFAKAVKKRAEQLCPHDSENPKYVEDAMKFLKDKEADAIYQALVEFQNNPVIQAFPSDHWDNIECRHDHWSIIVHKFRLNKLPEKYMNHFYQRVEQYYNLIKAKGYGHPKREALDHELLQEEVMIYNALDKFMKTRLCTNV